jgi:hypothetical protein
MKIKYKVFTSRKDDIDKLTEYSTSVFFKCNPNLSQEKKDRERDIIKKEIISSVTSNQFNILYLADENRENVKGILIYTDATEKEPYVSIMYAYLNEEVRNTISGLYLFYALFSTSGSTNIVIENNLFNYNGKNILFADIIEVYVVTTAAISRLRAIVDKVLDNGSI